ncbi:MAG TPA: hypothetical protein VMU04_00790 [Candidatus Acidoferrum sp.]|nr:hypothetical protein [Candidatus Acidoferrum sp.]
MNTRLTFLMITVLTLLPGLPAQAADEAKAPPTPAGARQAISDKLERIRFDTIRYDGLPLGEVVNTLRDEARKRDPEKKGINFIINPNPPAEAAPSPAPMIGPDGRPLPTPPQEAVDISGISIKINPPLNDVRLVDALDAVVKVADHPIKYTIEDYGVVFSLRGAESAQAEDVTAFAFPGGTPAQFLDAVQHQFHVDWASVADIPPEMAEVRIPRLRINQESLAALGRGGPGGNDPLAAVVSLYNQLWENRNELGRLVVKGDLRRPSVVMFVPDMAAVDKQARIKVKAFSIFGVSDAERARLQEDIQRATLEAKDYASHQRGPADLQSLQGTVALHNETSLLVATGPEPYVEMVESIVNACLAKERARNPIFPMALPDLPAK